MPVPASNPNQGLNRGKTMNKHHHSRFELALCGPVVIALLVVAAGCGSKAPAPAANAGVAVKKAASKEQSGFLKDYSSLKADSRLEGEVLTYVNPDLNKNLHGYVGVVIDPVEIYMATDGDASQVPAPNAERAALYFKSALIGAVQDALPVVHEAGPLVLRLRAAIVGVDTGGEVQTEDGKAAGKAVNISKAIVELELQDSVTGDVIAAVQDKEAAGAGEIGVGQLSREERFQLAKTAMDTWALRVRQFLNAAHELSPADAEKARNSYRPYGN